MLRCGFPLSDLIGVSATLWGTAAISVACVTALLIVRDIRTIGLDTRAAQT